MKTFLVFLKEGLFYGIINGPLKSTGQVSEKEGTSVKN